MSKATATRIPNKPSIRTGQDRDPSITTPFGLGAPPSPGAAAKCLSCGFGNVPVVEEVVWTIVLPMSHNAVQRTFGDTVNLFGANSGPEGVCSVDTTFLINGILQTDLYMTGLGIHVFVEPLVFARDPARERVLVTRGVLFDLGDAAELGELAAEERQNLVVEVVRERVQRVT